VRWVEFKDSIALVLEKRSRPQLSPTLGYWMTKKILLKTHLWIKLIS